VVDPSVTDFVGPTGNATDKYQSRNPLLRWLLARFFEHVEGAVASVRPTSILDVGCGEGIVTERLAARTGARTLGVDRGDERLAREWAARSSQLVSFRPASAYDLPFADRSFDCVCALEVLEHLERPNDALAELARVSGRALVLSVPREPLWRLAHLAAGRNVRRLGNTPGHLNHWSSPAFVRLVENIAHVEQVATPFPWTVVLARPRR
jgi:ubiquinone/menaquinone biosynthesis C-methylase UbiE